MIKIVTGMRRSGKSYLLNNLFSDYLLQQDVKPNNIIKIPLDNFEFRKLRDGEVIYDDIKNKLDPSLNNYIIIDEVQMSTDFVEVLNGLNSLSNTDIYVSGNNAKLLSKDIVTEFRGRGDEVKINPLNFGKYWSVYEGYKSRALDEFMLLVLYPRFLKERMKNRRHIF